MRHKLAGSEIQETVAKIQNLGLCVKLFQGMTLCIPEMREDFFDYESVGIPTTFANLPANRVQRWDVDSLPIGAQFVQFRDVNDWPYSVENLISNLGLVDFRFQSASPSLARFSFGL